MDIIDLIWIQILSQEHSVRWDDNKQSKFSLVEQVSGIQVYAIVLYFSTHYTHIVKRIPCLSAYSH